MKRYIALAGLSLFIYGCSGDSPEEIDKPHHAEAPLKIVSPQNDTQYTVGDAVEIEISVSDAARIKNLEFFFSDTLYTADLKAESQKITLNTTNGKVGFHKIYFSYEDEKGEKHGDTRTIVFFADSAPEQLAAVNMKVYPHDKSSYTQGLEFYKGKLYEGTGQAGQSILGEVDLNSGKIVRKTNLEPRYFGEGITILNDTIYQITWSEKTCFVYDLNFTKIKEFSYEGEGWGLCNDGEYLIMTNGSNEIVWRNRHTFAIEKKIYAFTNESDVSALNELELINGTLYINVYQEDRIIAVDTATGKVIQEIDCSSISSDGRTPGADVLNGIAYNPETGKTYITGKWWPKLYEVKFESR
ncbi:MAG: glutaminyl-peptide cyclotransferase [Bacteroidetes bacterium]|nr:glutaminyl-peptide cyclotransferase [Bacteroidota bacterium]